MSFNQIQVSLEASKSAIAQLELPHNQKFIHDLAHLLCDTFKSGNKIIIAGNGGSLCDAAHFAEELTGFFREKRKALPAIALSEPGHLSCVGNDLGFDFVFSRGVEAFGKPGDVFIGLTTSGKSLNIIHAFETAKSKQLKTVLFLGKDGGQLKGLADLELLITNFTTSDRIQEAHMTAIHVAIEIMELLLFSTIPQVELTFA
ncbi:Phosphoheptose isomerase [Candidatus Rubidus massiliensis]|nr:MAG: phosphoheptose isomerase [Chlamydia sp. 32-24]CDZ80007.1 Phosphoheptose isomerase [Candidatus Rubidus massiliensis]